MSCPKWNMEIDERARKVLNKIDKKWADAIIRYIYVRLANSVDPRSFGKPLSYDKHGIWRYRVGDYRILCEIYDDVLVIVAVQIDHRKNIYKEKK